MILLFLSLPFPPDRWTGLTALLLPLALVLGLLLLLRRLPAVAGSKRRRVTAWLFFLVVSSAIGLQLSDRLGTETPTEHEAPLAGVLEFPDTISLDAGGSFSPDGTFGDQETTFSLRLGRASTLELRMGLADGPEGGGITLLLGSEPRFKTSFVRQSPGRFELFGLKTDSLAFLRGGEFPGFSAVEHEVRVTYEQGRYSALVDDRLAAQAEDCSSPVGSLLFLACRGAVQLRNLKVVPLPSSSLAAPVSQAWRAPLAALLLLLAAGLATLLLGGRLGSGLGFGAVASLPLLAAVLFSSPATTMAATLRCALLLGSGLLLLLPLLSGRAGKRPLAALALGLLVPGIVWTVWPGAVKRDLPSVVDLRTWSGRHLEEPLLSLQHPALRLGNPYFVDHRFRSGAITVQKMDAQQRVFWLGRGKGPTSPLRQGLSGTEKGRMTEVVDASWAQASLPALHRFTRDVLTEFAPDLLVLQVSPALLPDWIGVSADTYLARITDPHYRRTYLDRLREEQFEDAEPSVSERLRPLLRRFCALAREQGVELLILARTTRAGESNEWLETVRDVARESGTPLLMAPASDSFAAGRSFLRELVTRVSSILRTQRQRR